MAGEFFAVGKAQWNAACKLGLNPAVCFLALARGTGADNVTTKWSAEAAHKTTGISWRRADAAIDVLEKNKLATRVNERGNRKPPIRKLTFPSDLTESLWLPNTLVSGLEGVPSPIARLRQTQNVDFLQAFVELYGVQDLAGDGGLPRSLVWRPYSREHVCDVGQFRVYGFSADDSSYCKYTGPLSRFKDWQFLTTLRSMGLLQQVTYLAEGDSPDSELLHALSGDEHADAVGDILNSFPSCLPELYEFVERLGKYDYVIPVLRDIPAPAVVGIFRLAYRPHTRLTAAWYSNHVNACARFVRLYSAIKGQDFQSALAA